MAILGEVFSIIRNGASIKQIDGANGFPITRIETISNRVIDRNRLGYANVFDITEYESYVLQSGDILMSHINSEKHLGKTALYIKKGNEKIIHGMNLLMLRANSEVILPLYAKYFFDSNLFLKQIPNITKKSVNQASFTVTALKKLEIKIPQMVEQKRIIDIMSRLDNIIQYRKDQLEKLDLFVKSRFIEMFGDPVSNPKGWILKKLSDLGQFKNGINFHFDDAGIEIYCLGVGNFKNNDVLNNMKELSLISLSNLPSEEYFLHDNDIVFVRSNGNKALVGRCLAVYPGEVPVIFSGFCIRFRKNNDSILIPYLLHILKCESVRRKLTGRGANIQNLNQQILGNLIIPLPPLELQNRFATFVIETNKSKLAIQQSLDELETLKKSLMQQYFG